MTGAVLRVRDLRVDFLTGRQWHPAVAGVDLDLSPGEVLAVVGESGSGKTTVAMSLLRLLPRTARMSGTVELDGRDLTMATRRTLTAVRGRDIAAVFQQSTTSFNAVYPIGAQIVEALEHRAGLSPQQARGRAVELLAAVEMPEPQEKAAAYPHQLSGGQLQRAMIAQALALEPRVLVADEPTTALDVTVQAEILELLRNLRDRRGIGMLLISHDMGVVADLADRVMVMREGVAVEAGTTQQVFYRPTAEYTRTLLAAVPRLGVGTAVPAAEQQNTAIATLTDVCVDYPKQGKTHAFRAVHDVSFTIGSGEVVGLVGESGSGKTTIGRALCGLLPVAAGRLQVAGTDLGTPDRRTLLAARKRIGVVFQDPGSSLDPRRPVYDAVAEPLRLHTAARRSELDRRVAELLEQVQLPRSSAGRYPHELSGGQRQRASIARALALGPDLLVADEPTSSLDVSVQARILDLFAELQRELHFGCLFISHDLAVVERLAHRMIVMSAGRVVEGGPTNDVLTTPRHPYTRRLIDSIPVPDPDEQRARRLRLRTTPTREPVDRHRTV